MQVDLSMYEPAELRLVAKFVTELADIREARTTNLMKQYGYGSAVGSEAAQAETAGAEEKPKRSRRVKEEQSKTEEQTAPGEPNAATATEAAGSTPSQTSGPAPAEEPKAEESFDENTAAQPGAIKVTHDDLRVLFGTLSQNGKRNEGIAVFREKGYNGVAAVKEEDLPAVYAELKKLEVA